MRQYGATVYVYDTANNHRLMATYRVRRIKGGLQAITDEANECARELNELR